MRCGESFPAGFPKSCTKSMLGSRFKAKTYHMGGFVQTDEDDDEEWDSESGRFPAQTHLPNALIVRLRLSAVV